MTVSIFNKDIPMLSFEIEKLPPRSKQELILDQDVLNRVVNRSKHLENLSLEKMIEIHEPAR